MIAAERAFLERLRDHERVHRQRSAGLLADERWDAHLEALGRAAMRAAEVREKCPAGQRRVDPMCNCDQHEVWRAQGEYDPVHDRRDLGRATVAAMGGAVTALSLGLEINAAWERQRRIR